MRARDSTVTKGPDLARLPKEIYILYTGGGGGCSNARGCTENTKESNVRRVREGEARGDPLVSTRSRGLRAHGPHVVLSMLYLAHPFGNILLFLQAGPD